MVGIGLAECVPWDMLFMCKMTLLSNNVPLPSGIAFRRSSRYAKRS